MKTYLIKKEFKSVWKISALAIVAHFIAFFYAESQKSNHSFVDLPNLLLSGQFLGRDSPLEMNSEYIQFFSILSMFLGAILAIVQINQELQLKTLSFLMHRPVTKKEVLDSKVVTGLMALIISICLPFSFVVFTCLIPGNYAAPFCLEMTMPWFLCLYFACHFYLGIFYCIMLDGKFLKWLSLLSLPAFFWIEWEVLTYLSGLPLFLLLLIGITIWYLALIGSFEERDLS